MGIRTKLTNEIELILDIMSNNGTISKKQVYFILKDILGKSDGFIETNISVIYTGKRIVEIQNNGITYYNLNTPDKSGVINFKSVMILWGILDTITYGDPESLTEDDRTAAIMALTTLRPKKEPFTSSYIFKNAIYNTAFLSTAQLVNAVFIANDFEQNKKMYKGVEVSYQLIFKSQGEEKDDLTIAHLSEFELDKKMPHTLLFVTPETTSEIGYCRVIEVDSDEEL